MVNSMSKKKRIWLVTFFLCIPIFTVMALYLKYNGQSDPANAVTDSAIKITDHSAHKKVNILVLGIDKRRNDIGRSNVTCVINIDTDSKNVALLWIPRDSRVKIPGQGFNKIGHAYAYGGPKLSEQTVADLLGIPIDYYVAINMDGFKKVIDALGGVDINVDKRMYYYDPYDEGEVDNDGLIDLKPGLQHMNGNTALQYVRFRHDEMGDIGRIERQQKFIKALLADLVNPSVITKIPGVIREANTVFETNMPVSEMLSLARFTGDIYSQGLQTDMVSGKPVYIDNLSFWLPDIAAMRKQVAQIQGITMDDQYQTATKNLANEYASALAKTKVVDVP